MKKILSILVVLTVMCSAVMAIDENPNAVSGTGVMKSGSLVKLFYRGAKQGDVKVTIFDARGKRVFNETIRNVESFVRPYNFSTLAHGQYKIELESKDGKQIQIVNYVAEKVKSRLIDVGVLSGQEGKYILRVSNKGSEQLTIKVYNSDGQVVYTGEESVAGDFAKIYNLQTLTGKVSFSVTDSAGLTQFVDVNK